MSLINLYYLHEIGEKKTQEDYIWPVAGNANLQSSVFIICDGVGGSENGEIASRIVAETVGNLLVNRKENEISPEYVRQLLQRAKKELVSYASSHGLNNDMATTFSLLALLPGKAFISWCGDSRVYHVRNGQILFKTEDHSLVNNLVKKGELDEDEAKRHPGSNIILKAIKADEAPVEADFHWIESVVSHDYFLLCSDGLLENVSNDDIRYLLSSEDGSNKDVLTYIQQKCKDKTRDNYSMYLLEVNAEPINTDTIRVKRRSRSLIILLLLALAIIVCVAFFMKANTGSQSLPAKQDSTIKQTEYEGKSAPGTNTKLDTGSLPVFEIQSSDSVSGIQEDAYALPVSPIAKDSIASISNNTTDKKKKSKKPVLPKVQKKQNH